MTAPPAFDEAVSAYLDHLRVERGLARHTLVAYASDLRLFGRGAAGIAAWAGAADPARDYIASLGRGTRPLR
ncbi:MAG: site-specific integrase, partial [Candidatus Limnocylindrales bacterium]